MLASAATAPQPNTSMAKTTPCGCAVAGARWEMAASSTIAATPFSRMRKPTARLACLARCLSSRRGSKTTSSRERGGTSAMPQKTSQRKPEFPLFIQRLVRHPRGSWTPTRCPLMALSGLSDAPITRSAFGPIADMPNEHVECPLMTRSGHLLRTDAQLSGRACRSDLRCAHWFSHAVEDDNALATAAGR